MSVLVKGYEMPKDGCKDCVMVKRGQVFDICPFLKKEVNGNVERGGKPNGCPLVDAPDTNVGDMIFRQDAIDATWEKMTYNEPWNVLTEVRKRLKALTSAQPEQPTQTNDSNTLNALDCISRQAAIDAIEAYFGDLPIMGHYDMVQLIKKLPSAQPEITDADVQEYCRKRDLVVITYDLFHEMQRRWSKTAQPEPEEFEWCTDCKEYDQESHCCHRWTKVIRNTVEEIKNTQPEPRWIPVEERLPEVGKRVLVTIPLVNGHPWVGIAWHGTPMYEDKVCFYVADSEWGDYEIREVTAWMPLPAGYERSDNAEIC